MRYSSPPVQESSASSSSTGLGGIGLSTGVNAYAAPNASQRQGYVASPPINGAMGYQSIPNGMGGPNQPQPGVGVGAGQQGFGGWPGMNDATAQMGVQFGKSAVAAGQDYVEKNFTRYLPLQLIKTSFSVTNFYVLNKLRLVLFPWRHKPWARQVRRSGDGGGVEGWMPPRDDINAPDLYIPIMALVTYTLLAALASGLRSKFDPELLGISFSKALAVVLVEFFAIKLGCYLLDVRGGGASGVELIGYGGYKFVGITVTIFVSFLKLGSLATTLTFIYTFCANAFFLLRSLKYVLLPDPSAMSAVTSGTLSHAQRSRRVQFLFVMAVSQVLWMGWLSRV